MEIRVCILTFFCLILSLDLSATKLVTYSFRGETRLGAWLDGEVIDLNLSYRLMLEERRTPRARARADAFVPPRYGRIFRWGGRLAASCDGSFAFR